MGVKRYCFASTFTSGLLRLVVQPGQPGRVELAQAGVGGRDQKTAALRRAQPHADVAGRGMHITPVEQAAGFESVSIAFPSIGTINDGRIFCGTNEKVFCDGCFSISE